jgi:hypothetical protein
MPVIGVGSPAARPQLHKNRSCGVYHVLDVALSSTSSVPIISQNKCKASLLDALTARTLDFFGQYPRRVRGHA